MQKETDEELTPTLVKPLEEKRETLGTQQTVRRNTTAEREGKEYILKEGEL